MQEDEPTKEEREEFKQFLKSNIEKLAILGDFSAIYIQKNQEFFISNDWKDVATEILTALFKYARIEVPEWVKDFVQETQVQNIAQEQEQIVRGFLAKLINDTYSRNFRAMSSSVELAIEINKLENRFLFSLDRDLISFLKRRNGMFSFYMTLSRK